MKKLMLSTASLLAALPALAQEVATEAAAPVMDKGDVSWMMISSVLVLFMTLPGLALFYGGLVRRKNVLSVLAQCLGQLVAHRRVCSKYFLPRNRVQLENPSHFLGGLVGAHVV